MYSNIIVVHKKIYDKRMKPSTTEYKDVDKMNEDNINKLKNMIKQITLN